MSRDASTIASTSAAPTENSAALPDDVATLQALLRELLAALEKTKQRNAQLEHRLDQLLRRVYGQKSEKLDPAQRLLFVEEEPTPALAENAPQPAVVPGTETITATSTKGHGRRSLPADLPRVRKLHDLTEAEKLCPCCQMPRSKIGDDVSEQLEFVPASLFVIEHVTPKYVCPKCRDGIASAAKPEQPIDKGLPGPGLLAHVAVSKYADHLPLNRQEKIFRRHGVTLSRSTLCDWMMSVADLVQPLVDLMRREILKSWLIQTDDTPVDVLDRDLGQKSKKTGRLWVYRGDVHHPWTAFDYTPNRSRAGPQTWLGDYRGFLQCDAYAGYDELFRKRSDLIEVGCWAHARRYFFEAKESEPVQARLALLTIGKLYDVERRAGEHDPSRIAENLPADLDHRRTLRQTQAKPVMADFHQQLVTWQRDSLPKSPFGQAVQYALNQWTALNRYLDDAALPIDNNASERDLRGVALGRKNWLFCGSDRGGHAAATILSLNTTCQRHGVEPFGWLRDMLINWHTLPRDAASRPTDEALASLLPRGPQPTSAPAG